MNIFIKSGWAAWCCWWILAVASVYTLGDGVFFFLVFFLEGVSSKHTALRIHVKMCSKITKEVHGTNESDIVVAPITYLIYLLSKIKKKKRKKHTTQTASLQFSCKEVPMACGSGQGCAAEIKRPLHSCVKRPKVQGGMTWYFLSSTVKPMKNKAEHRIPSFFLMLGEPPSSGRWKLRQIHHGCVKICLSGQLGQECLGEFSA